MPTTHQFRGHDFESRNTRWDEGWDMMMDRGKKQTPKTRETFRVFLIKMLNHNVVK